MTSPKDLPRAARPGGHTPRHARVPASTALLRRHRGSRRSPRLRGRHAAIGSIAAGAVVFVVASLTSPLASADQHHRPTAGPAAGAETIHRAGPVDLSGLIAAARTDAPVVAPEKVLRATPARVPTPAPATKAVITGLAANGIPTIALNAYRVAAARMDHADPGCGIDWPLLAGIGRIESDHGRYGGAVFDADGTTTPKIIGPALDGIHYDFVPAPADGLTLDGDARYAHALGPMQFIPQTWAAYGADADGDGVADVFDIDDAALGAARYLCAAGGNLRTAAGQRAAVLAYNHSDEYVAQVLALADAYRRGVPVSGIPIVGNTTGALGSARTTDVPPANPGRPAAAGPANPAKKPAADPKDPKKTGKSKAGPSTPPTESATSSGGTTPANPAAPISTLPAPTSSAPAPASSAPAPPTASAPPAPPTSSPAPTPPTKQCKPLDIACWLGD